MVSPRQAKKHNRCQLHDSKNPIPTQALIHAANAYLVRKTSGISKFVRVVKSAPFDIAAKPRAISVNAWRS